MRISVFLVFLSLLLTACGGDVNEEAIDQGGTEEDGMKMNPNPEADGITLKPMQPTTAFPNASIDDWTYEKGTFTYATSGYEFGQQTPDAESVMCANSAKGQHAHLIINNEPYIAKYEPTFDQALPDGSHYILTFLSRSYHESIKTPAAHRAVKTNVADGAFTNTSDIEDPMLFYSRPKGTYRGKAETENVMLDFYPVNAPIGEKYQIKATVNGRDFMIDKWQPYVLTGLPMGENKVTLTLMMGDEIVNTPLNPVTRTFTLEALPTEESK